MARLTKKTTLLTKTPKKTVSTKRKARPARSAAHNQKISEGMRKHFAKKKREAKKAAKQRRK